MQSDQNVTEVSGCVLALDVGGSAVKSGLVFWDGRIAELAPAAVDSSASARVIVRALAEVLSAGLRAAEAPVCGIGVAIPGPFDYARGVSLMTHKFSALKDLPLGESLRAAVPEAAGLPFRFMHDANAFLAGEMWRGAGRGLCRCLGVTLGTGIGVSCRFDGVFRVNALGSPASEVSVWSRPYKGGTVEDAVSTRGLVSRYRLVRPEYPVGDGAKGIADAARRGDAEAGRIFAELGEDLAAVLLPVCERFRPERIIFGGRIANDFALFETPLNAALARRAGSPLAVSSELGGRAALLGAAGGLFGGVMD
ncbi:MAG TPA: ROK family protein [Kiritimatiellia bacterium]|nr:ROK family protein [Kiritimatiellia bacterium]HPS07072.1 ROK family protein [Kiritimatiellia bacterium]